MNRSAEIGDSTPIIIGVGRFWQPATVGQAEARSTLDMAAEAARLACEDTGAAEIVLRELDALVCLRSQEELEAGSAPFGKPANFPRAMAQRLAVQPRTLVLSQSDRTVPLSLLREFGGRVASDETRLALIVGAEAATVAHALSAHGVELDWSDASDGEFDDRGRGLGIMQSRYASNHGIVGPGAQYGLIENARRAKRGDDRESYAAWMRSLVASLGGERDGAISIETFDPCADGLLTQEGTSQSAAIVITSVAAARRMGVDPSRWTYLAGFGFGADPALINRHDIAHSTAADTALREALAQADRSVAEISAFKFEGAAPVALVAPAVDCLGLDAAEPHALLVSPSGRFRWSTTDVAALDGIAAMVEAMRSMPGGAGLLGTDGGALSRYAAAVFSATPVGWPKGNTKAEYTLSAQASEPIVSHSAAGWAKVLTYTIVPTTGGEPQGIVMGVLEENGERFYAVNADAETLAQMREADPLGRRIFVRWTGLGHRFAFDRDTIERVLPVREPALRASYEHIVVARHDHILEVTINRPEVRNCLVPDAHAELSDVFDAFEADPNLWVAIITGAGTQAFCAGNDLKYAASGKPVWLPSGGFGGLVGRSSRTKPVIAAVNGFAFGGGFEIAMACDIVVADETARFALSEVKVGLIATGGGLSQLPRQLPRKFANELILTARSLSAEEALRFGFVSRVEPAGEAMGGARQIADAIVVNSPTAIRLTLRAMREAERIADPAKAALSTVRSSLIDELLASEDMVEGTRAFAAKRAPVWRNR